MINHRGESEGQLSNFTMRRSMRRRKSQKSLPQITQIDAEGKGEKKLSNYKITNSKIKQVDAQEKMPKNFPQNTQIIAERGEKKSKNPRVDKRGRTHKKNPADDAE